MRKQILAAMMVIVLLGTGAAFAGPRNYGPGHQKGFQQGRQAPDSSWIDKAPQNIQDAFKQIDIKHSEMRLEISKGNIDENKLRTLHNDMLKARRTIADYYFDQALKDPTLARNSRQGFCGGFGPKGGGYGYMQGGMHKGLFFELQSELMKDKPDAAKAKQLYADITSLSEKHARENFELALKYPESLSRRGKGYF